MRRGFNPKLVMDGDVFVGVSLGADYCTEHEMGIADLVDIFDLHNGPRVWGIERRRVHRIPPGFQQFSLGDTEGFYYLSYGELLNHRSEFRGTGIRAAWSDNSFGVITDVPTPRAHLRTLYDEFLKNNAVIALSGGGGFLENPGLCLAIADRIPQHVASLWHDADKERYDLDEEMKSTGIEELLRAHNKRYFSLRPRRQPDGSVNYHLNPMDQDRNKFGTFTLGELKQWAEGNGPIVIRKAS